MSDLARRPDMYAPFPLMDRFHWIALGVLFLAVVLASFNPLDKTGYLMHQTGTVIGVGLLCWLTQLGKVSKGSFALAIGFILIHVLGAHYLYSFVPYNDWFKAIGYDLDKTMGWSRNMYDRLVHISYGLLLYPMIADVFGTWFPTAKRGRIALLAIQFIMASSLVYELIEWLIAIGMSPEDAENYNGQQGDQWDAHKDMALATLGGVITWLIERVITVSNQSTVKR